MKKVLIIHQKNEEMMPVAKLLRRLGYTVYLKACAKKALMILSFTVFDSILVSEKLKDMSGIEFISKIKCPINRKKIIFMTQTRQIDEWKTATSMGIKNYFHSIIGWVDLVIIIDREIGGREALCMN